MAKLSANGKELMRFKKPLDYLNISGVTITLSIRDNGKILIKTQSLYSKKQVWRVYKKYKSNTFDHLTKLQEYFEGQDFERQ
jgi:hypothetical protein